MIKLSILIPSTNARWDNFNLEIQRQVFGQYDKLSILDKQRVEVLMLVDTKTMPLGEKRNWMVEIANGEYVVHVDSDDVIADDYIKTLLDATEHGADVITFNSEVTINGGAPKICDYSIKHGKDQNTPSKYLRIPNHITAIKRDIVLKCSFPSIAYGEDAAFSKLAIKHLKTEHKIDRVLYYYKYNDNTTETQLHLAPTDVKKRRQQPPIVDIIILSKASDERLKKMTQKTVDTAISGANLLPVNVIVIEQQPDVKYNNAQTIYHNATFNYNQFMNLGARQCSAEWIIFANNDLVFNNGYLHEMLIVDHPVMSPHEKRDVRQKDITKNTKGTTNGKHFSGWCFMMKRDIWNKIGGLDEDFLFWYSDDATIEQCIRVGVKPMLVKKSLVDHLGSTTFNKLDREKKDEYTWLMTEKFNKKYGRNKFHDNPYYREWKNKRNGNEKR